MCVQFDVTTSNVTHLSEIILHKKQSKNEIKAKKENGTCIKFRRIYPVLVIMRFDKN